MRLLEITVLMFVFFISAMGQQQPKPTIPFVDKNVCPFEYGCDFHKWYPRSPIRGFSIEGDTTALSFVVAAQESLQFNFGNMHIERLGVVVIRKSFEGYNVGDTVFILSYTGEGSYNIWHNGIFENVDRFWSSDTLRSHFDALETVEVSMSWWVNVTDASGRVFWLRLFNTEGSGGIWFAEDIEMKQIGFEGY
jgi:hypothetical protein